MTDENNKIIDLETLSHFKAKQDLHNLEKFKLKGDGTDLVGAVRYDTAQVLTPEQKAQVIANLGLSSGDGVIIVEGTYSVGGTTEYVNITNETAATIKNNLESKKPMLLYLDNYVWYYHAGKGEFTTLVRKGKNSPFCTRFVYVDGQTQFVLESVRLPSLDEEGKIADEYLPDSINVDTSVSWENIDNKPFDKSGWEFTWDGDPSSALDTFPLTAEGDSVNLYKISNDTVTPEQCIDATVKILVEGITYTGTVGEITPIAENSCYMLNNKEGTGCFVLVLKDDVYNFAGVELDLSAGIWSINLEGNYSSIYLGNTIYKTIDECYIPHSIPRLDPSGLIPSSLLPSYVDDVVEGYYHVDTFYEEKYDTGSLGATIEPESGKIYVDLNTGNTYRWSGSIYVRMNPDEYTLATTSDIDALFA